MLTPVKYYVLWVLSIKTGEQMSENLRDLTTDYKQLQELGLNEDSQVYLDTLEAVNKPIQDKGKNIALLLSNWNEREASINSEIKRLQQRKKVLANNKSRLKEWLKMNMIDSGINKIESDLFTITLGSVPKNSVVVIDDEASVPEEFKTVVETVKVNKALIKSKIRGGEDVNGAHLSDGNRALRIY